MRAFSSSPPNPNDSCLHHSQKIICKLAVLLVLMVQNLHGHGDLDVRIAELSRRILTNSSNAQLFLERGELHRLHQDWPAATADFDRAAALDSGLMAVEVARARLLMDEGRPRQAREAYDIYLAQATNDGVALIERARVRVSLKELEGALTDYTRAINLLPEPMPEYFVERAELAVRCGRGDQAITGLDEGLKRLGIIVTLQSKAIELELGRTNFDGALRRLETMRVRANRQELWLERQGQILRQVGRGAEAQAAYEAALQAVARLPARLQTTPQMESLKARVRLELNELAKTNAPATLRSNR